MRIRRVEGRCDVLGTVRVRLPDGLVAVVARDARTGEAFVRLLRRGLLRAGGEGVGEAAGAVELEGSDGGVPVPVDARTELWLGAGEDGDPGHVLEASARALARIRGGARLDGAFTRIVRSRGGEEGAALLARVDPEALRARIEELEDTPDRLRELEERLRVLRADHTELAGDVEVATMDWLRERQDAETHLQAYRDRARELKARLTELEEAGPEVPCPTCGRVLGEHFDDVVAELREEWESVVQDGSWWKRRREQLELKPEDLRELEGRSLRLQAATEECAERLERERARHHELRSAREHLRRTEDATGGHDVDATPAGEGAEDPAPALLRALNRVQEEMVADARERILDAARRFVLDISDSRLLGLTPRAGGRLAMEGVGARLADPTPEDRAAAVVALRLGALAALAAEDDAAPATVVVRAPFDRMDEESRLRTVDLLAGLGERLPHVLLVTRGRVVELHPEVFDAVLELRSAAGDRGPSVRSLTAGVGSVRIGPA